MANVRDVRQKLRVAMAILVGLNVFAIVALVYMMVRGTSTTHALSGPCVPPLFDGVLNTC